MEWITKKEIKERSTSAYEAFTVSIEKYEQCLKVSENEFRTAIKQYNFGINQQWCGCCQLYYHTKTKCSLQDFEECATCCDEYRIFSNAWNEWEHCHSISFSAFQDSVRLLLCRLYQERDKLPKEEKKPCKEEKLEHGDYGANNGMPWIHIAGKTYWWNTPSPSENSNESFIRSRDGNIFTDLEALKEPLEEFKTETTTANDKFVAQLENGSGHIAAIKTENGWVHPTLEQLEEIILNLRRLVATAKRKQSSLK